MLLYASKTYERNEVRIASSTTGGWSPWNIYEKSRISIPPSVMAAAGLNQLDYSPELLHSCLFSGKKICQPQSSAIDVVSTH